MGLVCFPFHQRRRTASDASPRLLLPDDSPSSSSDARELAERVLPFVPQRVATAFSDGLYNNGATGTTELPPEPRQLQAALLLVSRGRRKQVDRPGGESGSEQPPRNTQPFRRGGCRLAEHRDDASVLVDLHASPLTTRPTTFQIIHNL